MTDLWCDTDWDSHSCDRPRGHDGWHRCEPECGARIDQTGRDDNGFQWDMHGDDAGVTT